MPTVCDLIEADFIVEICVLRLPECLAMTSMSTRHSCTEHRSADVLQCVHSRAALPRRVSRVFIGWTEKSGGETDSQRAFTNCHSNDWKADHPVRVESYLRTEVALGEAHLHAFLRFVALPISLETAVVKSLCESL